MDADELQEWFNYLYVNKETEEFECNFCSSGDYKWGPLDQNPDARALLAHVRRRHIKNAPDRVKDALEEPTPEEIAEVFGLQTPVQSEH